MGMAASQARFLSLTARKSNVEYQGQQVNQQRTSLANESSNIFSQLQEMDVPTPPSVRDYMQTKYVFTTKLLSGESTSYSLLDITSNPEGDFAYLSYSKNYFQAAYQDAVTVRTTTTDDTTVTTATDTYGTSHEVSDEPAVNYASSLQCLKDVAGFANYFDEDGNFIEDSTVQIYESNNKTYFLTGDADSSTRYAYTIESLSETVSTEYPVASYAKNDLGRLTQIEIQLLDNDGNPAYETVDGEDVPKTVAFELDCVQVEDEAAYDQAMLDYEYEKSLYDKNVSDINAKTDAIQEKDRTLEIKLKQLDTEQSAISTEMDAVQKVVDDNVESTFKTFG